MKLPALIRRALARTRLTLNRKLFRAVANRLRRLRHEEHYNQGTWCALTGCGTTACIAGHTVIAAGLTPHQLIKLEGDGPHDVMTTATRLLGLNPNQANDLFCGDGSGWPKEYYDRFVTAKVNYSHARRVGEHVPACDRPSRVAADLLDAIADGKVKLYTGEDS